MKVGADFTHEEHPDAEAAVAPGQGIKGEAQRILEIGWIHIWESDLSGRDGQQRMQSTRTKQAGTSASLRRIRGNRMPYGSAGNGAHVLQSFSHSAPLDRVLS